MARKVFKGEAKLTMDVAQFLSEQSILGNLKAIWFHTANEISRNDNSSYGMKLRMQGKLRGTPDFSFLWDGGSAFIELKSTKGRLSPHQETFRKWCKEMNVPYAIVNDLNQLFPLLHEWGVL
jgi:hypothetical protein